MMGVEYWVMRIVVSGGAKLETSAMWCQLTPEAREVVALGLRTGRYQAVGDDICEPIECHDSRRSALLKMHREYQRTGVPHKVTLNADFDTASQGEIEL